MWWSWTGFYSAGGAHLTPASSIPTASARRGVHPNRASGVFKCQRLWWSLFSPAPAGFQLPEPLVEYLAPATVVTPTPVPVIECFTSAPAVFHAPAPMVEFIAPAPVVSESPVPVIEYFSPAPAVFSCTSAYGGVYCTRASSVPIASASGTCASCVLCANRPSSSRSS